MRLPFFGFGEVMEFENLEEMIDSLNERIYQLEAENANLRVDLQYYQDWYRHEKERNEELQDMLVNVRDILYDYERKFKSMFEDMTSDIEREIE